MKIFYQRKTGKRRKEIMEKWIGIAADYNNGMAAPDIAVKYNCSRAHVYYVLKKLNKE